MNILVLGATGNTGRRFVDMAIKRGHRIKAVVPSTAAIEPSDGLEVVQGDILDPSILRDQIVGTDAVVSCLGIRKKDPADRL